MLIRRRSILAWLVLVICAGTLAVHPASAKKAGTGFLDREVTVGGAAYKYQVFVPSEWTPSK